MKKSATSIHNKYKITASAASAASEAIICGTFHVDTSTNLSAQNHRMLLQHGYPIYK